MKKLNAIDRQRLVPREDVEQAALFFWASVECKRHALLGLLFAVPNGGYRPIKVAVALKETGVRPGVPDICLPVPRGKYHGLFVEMKRTQGGTTSANQKMWLDALNAQGYKAVVCKGFESARDTILEYLAEGEFEESVVFLND